MYFCSLAVQDEINSQAVSSDCVIPHSMFMLYVNDDRCKECKYQDYKPLA